MNVMMHSMEQVNISLLQKLGLGGLDISYLFLALVVLLLALIVLSILQLRRTAELKSRYEKFMQGERAASFEETVQGLIKDVDRLKQDSKTYANDIDLLFKKHESVVQKVALVKYNAFKEMGGQMSFCLVMLDEHDTGFILNCVHSTAGCYTYTKSVQEGKCEVEMSAEEQRAMREALRDQTRG